MKKILPIMAAGILVLSGLGAVALPFSAEFNLLEKTKTISFLDPIINENGEYLTVNFENSNSWLNKPNYPMLPAYIETFKFPLGTKIMDVKVTFSEAREQVLPKPIIPGTAAVPLVSEMSEDLKSEKDDNLFELTEIYPKNDYVYYKGAGLDGQNPTVFLTVKCYPMHYDPSENTLLFSDNIEINIIYKEPASPIIFTDEYDMVIIAPSTFSSGLQSLVDHKNDFGVRTILKTCEEIYDEYEGVDKPEQIKYFIKDAKEQWNITYVLLIGGLNSLIRAQRRDDANQGSEDWYVPVRYTNLFDGGGVQDPGCISDLYYADIYDSEMNFSSWDSNGDGYFAAWGRPGVEKDEIDLYPDVLVGRLACRNKIEVKNMVKKITNYEKAPADDSWFKKMVLIGGDTFDDVASTNFYEGEVENQKALDYMSGFDPVKVWTSHRDTGEPVPIPRDIIKAVSQGCGFLLFAGHGSPERWNTYWPEAFDEERAKGLWYYNMPFFYNRDKLPVCVVGGCHNSQFNVTATTFLTGGLWVYGPVPECFSWWLTRKIGGGTIATLGNTGLGYGKVGESGDLDGDGVNDPDCVEALGGYIETQFFKAYGVDEVDILGEVWAQAVNTYLEVYPGMDAKLDAKTVEQWPILGDPSLKIGGYE